MPDFKPSEVLLLSIPFVNTFHKAESEFMAACIVRACVRHGDGWQPIDLKCVATAAEADVIEKIEPTFSLHRNPFWRPHPHKLIEHGFVRRVGDDALEFTEEGFAALSKWVRKA